MGIFLQEPFKRGTAWTSVRPKYQIIQATALRRREEPEEELASFVWITADG